MSKLDYCFESHKSPNVHAMKKKIWYDMINNTPHQKFRFITYLLEDERELSYGMLIRLQRIYNFWLFHVVYYQSCMFYNHYIVILYHFLVLTYWHNAKCQLLFSACFLHRRKLVSDGVQMPHQFTMIFYEPEGAQRALVAPGGSPEEGTTHQGAPGGPDAPWWVVPTSSAPWTNSLL